MPRAMEGVTAPVPGGFWMVIKPMCVVLLLSVEVEELLLRISEMKSLMCEFGMPFISDAALLASADTLPVCQRERVCAPVRFAYPFVPSSAYIAMNPVLSSGKVAIFLPPCASKYPVAP